MEVLPKSAPEGFMNYLNSLNENDYIISVPINDTRTTTTQASLIENDTINEIDQMIDEIYLKYMRINHLTESEKKSIETMITNLRNLIMKFISSLNERINSLNEHICTLNDEIVNLKKGMHAVEQKEIGIKRVNIISEILSPLKGNIFREMSRINTPSDYYNVNVLKSLYWLNKGDITSANFYLNVHKMNNDFVEQVFNSLQNFIRSFSTSENISYDTLLVLLIEKEKRNFEEHSIITNFIRDSCQTNDSRLTSLLRQQNLLSAFQLTEIDVIDKIYTKYFRRLTNHS
ncbi:unnamed protein product [Rotaria sp. Silwood2]|nr:unnamed protein product [Rotaria sp. Silwood2]CAF4129929.1 unnamed protein product [Rotaria sp. Silwood2]